MKDLFRFTNDLGKILYDIGFKLLLKENKKDRAFLRVITGASELAKDCKIEIEIQLGVYLL